MREQDLYPPIKAFLEAQGYEVKAEVDGCDVVAMRRPDAPVIVEMKTAFSLALVLQGIARQGLFDDVYLAVPPSLTGVRAELQGWSIHPDTSFLYWNAYFETE